MANINDDTTTVILLCNTFSNPGSQMCFFTDVATSESGQAPGQYSTAVVSPNPNAGQTGFITWEGQQIVGSFLEHLFFTTQIQGTAASEPINTLVGQGFHNPPFAAPPPGQPPYGYNVFNIYRDNDRVVYTDPVLGDVLSIYYCTFAGTSVPSIPPFVPTP